MVADIEADFETWYEKEHPRLVATLILVLGDVDLARESVDEACARVLARWPRVARMDSPGGYAYRVALNDARRRARRAGLEARLLARHPVESVVPPPADGAWDLVRNLAPRQRTAVVLRYVADLTEADIARAMGVSRGTVSSTLIDARRRIARQLESDRKPETESRNASKEPRHG
jgi:DNA-directed RNA polymerase specialized sigma24 family protein